MSLPTGTVTFLFTDIEGSTRLMQELGPAYVDAQVQHHAILREAFNSTNGRELRTEGDSFFCVFQSALDACNAAATAQREFARREWPGGKAIRVRVGLHTGEAPLIGEEYIGLDVHHAARVAAAAHGGQIVISDATRALVEHSLPPDITLRELGTHRLKDLALPERLYQLVVEGAPDAFPPLRTLESTPNNLPTQLTSFIGREDQVEESKRLLHGTRVLTLTGPGGIGKTRLSLQVAADVVHQFPDGVFFVALSAVRDPDLIASTIAQSVGVQVTGNRTPADAIDEYLRGRKVLLVLDNFEQLLPDGAPAVAHLLQANPNLKVLVSSRAPLRVYGEQELALEPLRTPDLHALPSLAALSQYEAVKLFIERAVAVKHDFQVTNDNAPAIAGICERLDGLPLAIELAAARVKLFSPQALLGRLEKSAAVLGSGARDQPGRQQTLKGAIAWSYELLDASHRRLFDRFAVFARGAHLEQAEAVCGPASELDGLDVLTGLDELAEQSLLRRLPDYDEPRLMMLHVIREFASEQLQASGEADRIRDRHAAAFQALAEMAAPNLFGAEQKRWLDRLEIDHDNFRAAFDWSASRGDTARSIGLAAAFWRFWQMRGHLREGRARMDAILAMPGARDDPATAGKALETAGGVAYWQGEMGSVRSFYDEALVLARATGDPATIANALYNDSFPYQITRVDIPKAIGILEEARQIFRSLGDDSGVTKCAWGLGQCHYRMNDLAAAVEPAEEAIAGFRRMGDRFGLGWALYVRAMVALRLGDPIGARSRDLEALKIFADANDVSGAVLILGSLAAVARAVGDPIRGARLQGASEAQEVSSGVGMASVVGEQEGWRNLGPRTETEEAAYKEGRAMSIEQAIAYAMADSDETLEVGA